MWFDLLWYVCVAWTAMCTLAILRHDSVTNTARNASQTIIGAARAWTQKASTRETQPDAAEDADAEDEAEPAPPEPSVYAARDVRVFRHRVRPRATPIGRGSKPALSVSAAASGASAASASASSSSSWSAVRPLFAPLEFELELQWQAPPAVIEQGPRVPVTYEIRLQPEDGSPVLRSPASEEQQPMEAAEAPNDAREAEEDGMPQAIPPSIVAAPPSAPLIHRFTMGGGGDGGGGAERALPSASSSSSMDVESEESSADAAESSHSSDAGGESKEAAKAARPRKRKAASRSSSRAGGAARAPRVGRSAGLLADEDGSGSHGTFEEPRFTLQHPRAAAYTVSVLSSAGSYAAAAQIPRPGQAECLSAPLRFSFRLPALLYLVQCVPQSSADARQVLHALDKLLSVLTPRDDLRGIDWASIRTILEPRFSSRIQKRMLALLSRLIEWRCILIDLCANPLLIRAMQTMVDARLEHIAKKAAGERANKRARQHEQQQQQAQQPQQQQQQSPGMQSPASPEQQLAAAASASPPILLDTPAASASASGVDDSSFVASADPDDHAAHAHDPDHDHDFDPDDEHDPAAPQLLEPVLENIMWFCLKAIAIHDVQHKHSGGRRGQQAAAARCPATSDAADAAQSSDAAAPVVEDDPSLFGCSAALSSFVAAGGHMLLLSIVNPNTKTEWYPAYQADVLRALANICGQLTTTGRAESSGRGLDVRINDSSVAVFAVCVGVPVCTCCGVPAADSAAILHFLVRQATFGSDTAQDTLMHSAVRAKITNPYE